MRAPHPSRVHLGGGYELSPSRSSPTQQRLRDTAYFPATSLDSQARADTQSALGGSATAYSVGVRHSLPCIVLNALLWVADRAPASSASVHVWPPERPGPHVSSPRERVLPAFDGRSLPVLHSRFIGPRRQSVGPSRRLSAPSRRVARSFCLKRRFSRRLAQTTSMSSRRR